MPPILLLFAPVVPVFPFDRRTFGKRELERWAMPDGHLAWWRGKSIYEIRAGAVEDWSHWPAKRGIAAKTRRNVLDGLRSFVTWLQQRELIDTIPSFPEVPVDEYAPTLISARASRTSRVSRSHAP
jgi:hypothetical protein